MRHSGVWGMARSAASGDLRSLGSGLIGFAVGQILPSREDCGGYSARRRCS